jgi:hypothetical protein
MKVTAPTLTAAEVAAEFGRKPDWLHDNWRRLVAGKKLPPPLHQSGGLAWSAAQVYAYLDRGLSNEMRAAAAAYRAAAHAYAAASSTDAPPAEVERWKQHLAQRFGGEGTPS